MLAGASRDERRVDGVDGDQLSREVDDVFGPHGASMLAIL